MSTKPMSQMSPAPSSEGAGRSVAFVTGGLGVVLLVLALIALPSRLIELPHNDIREAILNDQVLSKADLKAYIQSRSSANSWHASADAYNDSAMAQGLLAQSAVGKTTADAVNQEAIESQINALSHGVLNTYGWTQLTNLLLQSEGATPRAAQAFQMSLSAAPYEPRLAITRLRLLIRLWDKLDKDAQALAPSVVSTAWDVDPAAVAAVAQHEHGLSIVTTAMTGDRDKIKKFNDLVAQDPIKEAMPAYKVDVPTTTDAEPTTKDTP